MTPTPSGANTPTPQPSEYPHPLPHEDPPPPSDEYPPPPLDPDCLAGKHRACLGRAWDEELDAEVECACGCHDIDELMSL